VSVYAIVIEKCNAGTSAMVPRWTNDSRDWWFYMLE